jgi:U3 small nucleolar RNA-associated protein 10
VSDSPPSSNQALLLLSTLAKLAPDSVLQNIMPVFTFMGSNVFHRDDSYSFRVIQKTVDSVVPVMVSSLTKMHQEHLDLLIGARNFVRVFTDAANHVPRHRRTQYVASSLASLGHTLTVPRFFIHLVDVLGSSEFLGLVCMLLIGKTANRIVRQQGEDLRATLALMLSLVQHYPAPTQLHVMHDVLEEAKRLLEHAVSPKSKHRLVLDATR